jgi:uncharacterized protein YndB with AHSA1/START domain
VATTSRSRELSAPAQAVWELVSDPHHLPRWWPGVVRVEDVSEHRFTQVVPTKRGKPMRLDLRVAGNSAEQQLRWTQELAGTPFERLLEEWSTTIALEPRGVSATAVTITETQRLRGSFRLGSPLQRRPARKRLDQALANLARLL